MNERWKHLQEEYAQFEKSERASGKLWAEIEGITDYAMGRLTAAEARAEAAESKLVHEETEHMLACQVAEDLRAKLEVAEMRKENATNNLTFTNGDFYRVLDLMGCESEEECMLETAYIERLAAEFHTLTAKLEAAERDAKQLREKLTDAVTELAYVQESPTYELCQTSEGKRIVRENAALLQERSTEPAKEKYGS